MQGLFAIRLGVFALVKNYIFGLVAVVDELARVADIDKFVLAGVDY